jgi:glutathione reductase (NADPH)
VTVNEYLQSVSNPAVYAAGDSAATDGPALTPVAAYHGQIVAANLIEGNHQKSDHSIVPRVVFTVPPLAAVGLQEEAARTRGLAFKRHHEQTASWYSSRRLGEESSGFKVLVEEASGQVLGAHLLGPYAEEIINLFAMAMRARIPAPAIKEMLFAYPTSGSDIQSML